MEFGAHWCLLDQECRAVGAANRIHLFTPWGTLMIGARSQGWLPFYGALDPYKPRNWWPVVWHPK